MNSLISKWRRRILRLMCLAVLASGASMSMSLPAEANVTRTFVKADRAFKKGHLRRALKIISGNIKKYPAHQPSQLLAGRIYYRLGKVGRAAQAFKRVPPDLLTPDMAYEYGIVFFITKSYDRAIRGFARVGKRARQIHLANFYRGICYMQSRQWERAQRYILRAKRLPPNLQSSKRRVLLTLKRRIQEQRRGLVTPGINSAIIVPQPPVYQQPYPPSVAGAPPAGGQGAAEPAPKPEPPPEPTSGFQSSITPSLSYEQKQKTQSFHGLQDQSNDSTELVLGIAWNGRYDADPVSSGGQPYFQTNVSLKQKNTTSRGVVVKYVAPRDDPTNLREEPEEIPSTDAKTAEISIVPEVGYPLANFIDLTGNFAFKESYPDGQAEEKSGSRTPGASASISLFDANLKVSFSQQESYDAEGTVTKTDTTFKGELDKSFDTVSIGGSVTQTTSALPTGPANPEITQVFKGEATKSWESFSMTASATQTGYTPAAGQVLKGAQAKSNFSLSGNKSFDFGGSLTLTGQLTQLADIISLHADPEDTSEEPRQLPMKTQGNQQGFTAVFTLSPLSWISASGTFKSQKNEYTVGEAKFAKDFEAANAEIETEFSLKVSLSTTF